MNKGKTKGSMEVPLTYTENPKAFCEVILKLIQENDDKWQDIWKSAISNFRNIPEDNVTCMNPLLSVTEQAFKSHIYEIRTRAFSCWQYFIEQYDELHLPDKVNNVLIIPLIANNHSVYMVVEAKLKVWDALLNTSLITKPDVAKKAVIHMLKFLYVTKQPVSCAVSYPFLMGKCGQFYLKLMTKVADSAELSELVLSYLDKCLPTLNGNEECIKIATKIWNYTLNYIGRMGWLRMYSIHLISGLKSLLTITVVQDGKLLCLLLDSLISECKNLPCEYVNGNIDFLEECIFHSFKPDALSSNLLMHLLKKCEKGILFFQYALTHMSALMNKGAIDMDILWIKITCCFTKWLKLSGSNINEGTSIQPDFKTTYRLLLFPVVYLYSKFNSEFIRHNWRLCYVECINLCEHADQFIKTLISELTAVLSDQHLTAVLFSLSILAKIMISSSPRTESVAHIRLLLLEISKKFPDANILSNSSYQLMITSYLLTVEKYIQKYNKYAIEFLPIIEIFDHLDNFSKKPISKKLTEIKNMISDSAFTEQNISPSSQQNNISAVNSSPFVEKKRLRSSFLARLSPLNKKKKIDGNTKDMSQKNKAIIEDDNAVDFVEIQTKIKPQALTEHQKEIASSKKYIPALYQDLSQDSQSINSNFTNFDPPVNNAAIEPMKHQSAETQSNSGNFKTPASFEVDNFSTLTNYESAEFLHPQSQAVKNPLISSSSQPTHSADSNLQATSKELQDTVILDSQETVYTQQSQDKSPCISDSPVGRSEKDNINLSSCMECICYLQDLDPKNDVDHAEKDKDSTSTSFDLTINPSYNMTIDPSTNFTLNESEKSKNKGRQSVSRKSKLKQQSVHISDSSSDKEHTFNRYIRNKNSMSRSSARILNQKLTTNDKSIGIKQKNKSLKTDVQKSDNNKSIVKYVKTKTQNETFLKSSSLDSKVEEVNSSVEGNGKVLSQTYSINGSCNESNKNLPIIPEINDEDTYFLENNTHEIDQNSICNADSDDIKKEQKNKKGKTTELSLRSPVYTRKRKSLPVVQEVPDITTKRKRTPKRDSCFLYPKAGQPKSLFHSSTPKPAVIKTDKNKCGLTDKFKHPDQVETPSEAKEGKVHLSRMNFRQKTDEEDSENMIIGNTQNETYVIEAAESNHKVDGIQFKNIRGQKLTHSKSNVSITEAEDNKDSNIEDCSKKLQDPIQCDTIIQNSDCVSLHNSCESKNEKTHGLLEKIHENERFTDVNNKVQKDVIKKPDKPKRIPRQVKDKIKALIPDVELTLDEIRSVSSQSQHKKWVIDMNKLNNIVMGYKTRNKRDNKSSWIEIEPLNERNLKSVESGLDNQCSNNGGLDDANNLIRNAAIEDVDFDKVNSDIDNVKNLKHDEIDGNADDILKNGYSSPEKNKLPINGMVLEAINVTPLKNKINIAASREYSPRRSRRDTCRYSALAKRDFGSQIIKSEIDENNRGKMSLINGRKSSITASSARIKFLKSKIRYSKMRKSKMFSPLMVYDSSSPDLVESSGDESGNLIEKIPINNKPDIKERGMNNKCNTTENSCEQFNQGLREVDLASDIPNEQHHDFLDHTTQLEIDNMNESNVKSECNIQHPNLLGQNNHITNLSKKFDEDTSVFEEEKENIANEEKDNNIPAINNDFPEDVATPFQDNMETDFQDLNELVQECDEKLVDYKKIPEQNHFTEDIIENSQPIETTISALHASTHENKSSLSALVSFSPKTSPRSRSSQILQLACGKSSVRKNDEPIRNIRSTTDVTPSTMPLKQQTNRRASRMMNMLNKQTETQRKANQSLPNSSPPLPNKDTKFKYILKECESPSILKKPEHPRMSLPKSPKFVNFADPVLTDSREYDTRENLSSSDADDEYDDNSLSILEAEFDHSSQEMLYAKLCDCDDSIDAIIPYLFVNRSWEAELSDYLCRMEIKTIGQLAKLSIMVANCIPAGDNRIARLRRALMKFEKNKDDAVRFKRITVRKNYSAKRRILSQSISLKCNEANRKLFDSANTCGNGNETLSCDNDTEKSEANDVPRYRRVVPILIDSKIRNIEDISIKETSNSSNIMNDETGYGNMKFSVDSDTNNLSFEKIQEDNDVSIIPPWNIASEMIKPNDDIIDKCDHMVLEENIRVEDNVIVEDINTSMKILSQYMVFENDRLSSNTLDGNKENNDSLNDKTIFESDKENNNSQNDITILESGKENNNLQNDITILESDKENNNSQNDVKLKSIDSDIEGHLSKHEESISSSMQLSLIENFDNKAETAIQEHENCLDIQSDSSEMENQIIVEVTKTVVSDKINNVVVENQEASCENLTLLSNSIDEPSKQQKIEAEYSNNLCGLSGIENINITDSSIISIGSIENISNNIVEETINQSVENEISIIEEIIEDEGTIEETVKETTEHEGTIEETIQETTEHEDTIEETVEEATEHEDTAEETVEKTTEYEDIANNSVENIVEDKKSNSTEETAEDIENNSNTIEEIIKATPDDINVNNILKEKDDNGSNTIIYEMAQSDIGKIGESDIVNNNMPEVVKNCGGSEIYLTEENDRLRTRENVIENDIDKDCSKIENVGELRNDETILQLEVSTTSLPNNITKNDPSEQSNASMDVKLQITESQEHGIIACKEIVDEILHINNISPINCVSEDQNSQTVLKENISKSDNEYDSGILYETSQIHHSGVFIDDKISDTILEFVDSQVKLVSDEVCDNHVGKSVVTETGISGDLVNLSVRLDEKSSVISKNDNDNLTKGIECSEIRKRIISAMLKPILNPSLIENTISNETYTSQIFEEMLSNLIEVSKELNIGSDLETILDRCKNDT